MSTLTTTSAVSSPSSYRREASGALQSALHIVLLATAAALTVIVWLSAFGAGTQPRGYVAEMMAHAPVRVQLPRVEIVASRSQLASIDSTAVACTADRSHKPA